MSESLEDTRETLLRYFARGMLFVIGISALTAGLSRVGFLSQWEKLALQMYQADILHSRAARSSEVETYLVEITAKDYQQYFHQTSPLTLKKDTVRKLIQKVVGAEPALVIVDLDLSDENGNQIRREIERAAAAKSSSSKPLVIWAQTLRPSQSEAGCADETISPAGRLNPLPSGVPESHLGIPLFPRDADGMVRSYTRMIPVIDEKETCTYWPSLVYAATRYGNPLTESQRKPARDNKYYLNFDKDLNEPTATDADAVLSLSPSESAQVTGLLRNKTVVLGGTYDPRDAYLTPNGEMPGMKLIAYAYEMDVHERGIREVGERASIASDLILGAIIVLISYRWHGRAALLGSCALAIASGVAVSLLLFNTAALFMNFVPGAVGAILNLIFDSMHEVEKLEARLDKQGGGLRDKKTNLQELSQQVEEKDREIAVLSQAVSLAKAEVERPVSVSAAVTFVESPGGQRTT